MLSLGCIFRNIQLYQILHGVVHPYTNGRQTHIGMRPNSPTYFKPVHPGHHHVQENDIDVHVIG